MPLILHIETATDVCSIGIARAGNIISLKETTERFQHVSRITLLIEAGCREAGIELNDLDAVAVSRGPGSFTALRIGTACAKGICYALDKPLLAVDTLQALTVGAVEAVSRESPTYYPMIDARRMEVYTAPYRSDLTPLGTPQAMLIDETTFKDRLDRGEEIVLTGNGAAKCGEVLHHAGLSILPLACSARYMAKLGEQAFLKAAWQDLAYFEPFYLKPPNITKSKKKI